MRIWEENIDKFIALADKHSVRMIMIGGGAVNFHGYQRHSADVDFWIETTDENLKKLVVVFQEMGYEIEDFPTEVKEQKQNISIKFSPLDLNLQLVTKFLTSTTFQKAYENSVEAEIKRQSILKWKVLSLDDLIESKLKAQRPKDLLDVQELQKIHNK